MPGKRTPFGVFRFDTRLSVRQEQALARERAARIDENAGQAEAKN
ncbi:hypothetical protein [Boudabousia liubingyangii]|nr:hypothetical protein [Boudabousia liubingyangii]